MGTIVEKKEKGGALSEEKGPFSWKTLLAFLVVGINPSWSIPCALFVEVPIFQKTAPEGLMLAAWMNIASNIGLFLTLAYVFVDNAIVKMPTETVINMVIFVSSCVCFVVAFTWTFTAFGLSATILVASILGGTVGSFQVLSFLPYLTRYHPYLFATARLGDVIFVGVLSLLGIAQQAANISPTLFFLIFAPTQILPLISMWHISKHRKELCVHENTFITSITGKPGTNTTPPAEYQGDKAQEKLSISPNNILKRRRMGPGGELVPLLRDQDERGDNTETAKDVEEEGSRSLAWEHIKESRYLIVIQCMINMHMWGSFISLLPIATSNAAPGSDENGSVTLAFANNLGLMALVPGIVLAPIIRLPEEGYYILATIQTLLYGIVYAAIFNVPEGCWGSYTSAIVVTVAFCVGRANEAYIATSIYTFLGSKYKSTSYHIASFMGVCDRIATTVFTWAAFFWVMYVWTRD